MKLFSIKYSNILSFLFILHFLSFLNLTFLNSGGFFSIGGIFAFLKGASRLIFILFGIYYLFFVKKYFYIAYKGPIFYLLVIFILAFASISYSADPFLTSLRIFEHFGIFIAIMALWISLEKDSAPTEIISMFLFSCILIVCSVWFAVLVNPIVAFRGLGELGFALGGEVLHSHTLGHLAVLASLIILARWRKFHEYHQLTFFNSTLLKYLLLILLFISIILTLSRSSLILLITGISYLVFFAKEERSSGMGIRRYFLASFLIVLFFSMSSYFVEIMLRGDLKSLLTLGSRSLIWSTLIENVTNEAPIFGYGYQMLSFNGSEFELVPGIYRGMAHNSFIQTLAGLGILGLLVLIAQTSVTFKHIFFPPIKVKMLNSAQNFKELIILSIVCIGASLTEFGLLGPTSPAIPMYMTIVVFASGVSKIPK